MNIFEYNDEEFDRVLNEVFDNIDKNVLKRELMECGLILQKQTKEINIEEKWYVDRIYWNNTFRCRHKK